MFLEILPLSLFNPFLGNRKIYFTQLKPNNKVRAFSWSLAQISALANLGFGRLLLKTCALHMSVLLYRKGHVSCEAKNQHSQPVRAALVLLEEKKEVDEISLLAKAG